MPDRAVFFALLLSLSAHAALSAPFWAGRAKPADPVKEAVFLSVVRYEPVRKPAPAPKPLEYPDFKKAPKAPVVKPVQPLKSETVSPAKSSPLPAARYTATPPAKSAASPKSSDTVQAGKELLRDPKKGRIFSEYFGRVRSKIDETVRREYYKSGAGEGSVTLQFILNSDGTLDKAGLVAEQTQADREVGDLALRCLRRSAPFGPFPGELQARRIAFNVTVLFEEL